jgi:hypothetical protein
VWELSVIDDCNTDGEVGNKECERLSGVVCNPTSTDITYNTLVIVILLHISVATYLKVQELFEILGGVLRYVNRSYVSCFC